MTLSILLPSYNNDCLTLVSQLQRQAEALDNVSYEIIVADDGGNNLDVKQRNNTINDIPNCRYIIREKNVGRAAIRNYLAREARSQWLLMIDSDVCMVNDDFLQRYIDALNTFQDNASPAADSPSPVIIDGGVAIVGNPGELRSNLRFWYEYKSAPNHTAEKRSLTPYQHIHTANLLVPASFMTTGGFDERFTGYGYEDVLFGKSIKEAGIPVLHIDAPVGLDKFEKSLTYIHKTEEALHTLHRFRYELAGYSTLLDQSERLRRLHLTWAVRLFHKTFYPMEKLNLISRHPSLLIFKLYKMGYYCDIKSTEP